MKRRLPAEEAVTDKPATWARPGHRPALREHRCRLVDRPAPRATCRRARLALEAAPRRMPAALAAAQFRCRKAEALAPVRFRQTPPARNARPAPSWPAP